MAQRVAVAVSGAVGCAGQKLSLSTSNHRHYVIAIQPDSNRIVVGDERELYCSRALATGVSWVDGRPEADSPNVTAKMRYRSPEVPAALFLREGYAEVDFQQPKRAVTPGQVIVFCQEDRVIGGGTIARPD